MQAVCWELRMWTKVKCEKLEFGNLMIWWEPKDHYTNRYFSVVKTSGYSKKNKSKIEYRNIRPVSHAADIPVPVISELHSLEDENCDADVEHEHSDSND